MLRGRLSPALLGTVAVVAAASTAEAFSRGAIDGEWAVKGSSTSLGDYAGKVTLKEHGYWTRTVTVTAELKTTGGRKVVFHAEGKVKGETVKFTGKTVPGIAGAISDPDAAVAKNVSGKYSVLAGAMSISGSWTLDGVTAAEKLVRSEPAASGDLLVLIDGNGTEVPATKKNTTGVVVAANIDDDDGDGGAGGDGATAIVSDKDDTNGVAKEDDLLPFRVKGPVGGSSMFALDYPAARIAVWRTKTKDPGTKVEPGKSFPAAPVIPLFIEGLAASPAGGDKLSVTLSAPDGKVISKDEGKVTVARSAFFLAGHGHSWTYSLESWLSTAKLDKRKDPVLVMGKGEAGKPVAWAVYIWDTEKGAKIALATEGACVAYDGHSNFGLGFAFATGFSDVRQFLNIADPQVPVNWEYLRDHQEHPSLVFADADYADDSSTKELYDPVAVSASVAGAHGSYSTNRFPVAGGSGSRLHLTRGAVKWQDNHYGSPGNLRIVVKAGSRDMPAKRWSKLFLNSCYSGPYYGESFGGKGTLFFTHEEASSSETSALFIRACVEGKSNEGILKDLNSAENINDYHEFGQ